MVQLLPACVRESPMDFAAVDTPPPAGESTPIPPPQGGPCHRMHLLINHLRHLSNCKGTKVQAPCNKGVSYLFRLSETSLRTLSAPLSHRAQKSGRRQAFCLGRPLFFAVDWLLNSFDANLAPNACQLASNESIPHGPCYLPGFAG